MLVLEGCSGFFQGFLYVDLAGLGGRLALAAIGGHMTGLATEHAELVVDVVLALRSAELAVRSK